MELRAAATPELDSVDSAIESKPQRTGLTRAEQGVAELVVEGLTNKQMAEELFVSHYTIDSHLRSIFKKLGVSLRLNLSGSCLKSSPRRIDGLQGSPNSDSRVTRRVDPAK